jgi:rhodanese-related sulfurtransferase
MSIAAADSRTALEHFEKLLGVETDCWDVHFDLENGKPEFVLLDVRSPESFAAGHIEGARNLPHRQIDLEGLASWPGETLFVVYCAGPHCNGADRAAVRLARLGRKVKKMIGGVQGWKEEGYPLTARP